MRLSTEDATSNNVSFSLCFFVTKHDKDKNGVIEGKELRGFYLWIDVNSNHHLDQGEIHKLKEYGIKSFRTEQDPKTHKSVAYLEEKKGKEPITMLMQDIWLERRRLI